MDLNVIGALEEEQMHRRATAVRDIYHRSTYTDLPDADHQLRHPNYLHGIKTAMDRLKASADTPIRLTKRYPHGSAERYSSHRVSKGS